MKAIIALALCATLAGCDRPESSEPKETVTITRAELPVGRFKMLPAGKEGNDIFLLDTVNGNLRRCWFGVKEQLKITCGDASGGLL